MAACFEQQSTRHPAGARCQARQTVITITRSATPFHGILRKVLSKLIVIPTINEINQKDKTSNEQVFDEVPMQSFNTDAFPCVKSFITIEVTQVWLAQQSLELSRGSGRFHLQLSSKELIKHKQARHERHKLSLTKEWSASSGATCFEDAVNRARLVKEVFHKPYEGRTPHVFCLGSQNTL